MEEVEASSGVISGTFLIFGGFIMAAGFLLIITITSMLAQARKSDFALLRIFGLKRRDISAFVMMEGVLASFFAGLFGDVFANYPTFEPIIDLRHYSNGIRLFFCADLCRQFVKNGSCSWGDRCKFRHPRKPTSKKLECYYCHKKGHIKADCRKRQREEAQTRQRAAASTALCTQSNLQGLAGINMEKLREAAEGRKK